MPAVLAGLKAENGRPSDETLSRSESGMAFSFDPDIIPVNRISGHSSY